GERQDSDRGPVGQSQCGPRLLYRARHNWRFRLLYLTHDAHKAHTFAGHGADEALVLSRVINRASHGAHAGTQRRLRDDPPAPDCSNQVVFADNPIAVFDQVFEDIEHLRSDGNPMRPTTQLAAVRVERKASESIEQIAVPRPKRRRLATLADRR